MNQIAIFGLGGFGFSLAKTLFDLGNDVYVIDKNQELINDIADKVTYAVQADVTDIHSLKSIGIQNVDIVVVAFSTDLNGSFSAVINAKELGVKTVYAKAKNDIQAKILYKLGVNKVIFPEKEMGEKLAHNLSHSSFLDLIELDSNHTLIEMEILQSWKDHSLVELNLRGKYNINVIVIKRDNETIINPGAEEILKLNDRMIVIGDINEINKLIKRSK